jgi:Fe-S cluster assembly protein SufD
MQASTQKGIDQQFAELERNLNGLRGSRIHQYRQQAMSDFNRQGIPNRKHEEWLYVDLSHLDKDNLDFPAAEKTQLPGNLIPKWEGHRLRLINGRLDLNQSTIHPQHGVEILDLGQTLHDSPERVDDILGRLIRNADEPLAALNGAFFAGGVFVDIADGVILEKPILIEDWSWGLSESQMTCPRHLIRLGRGAQARVTHLPVGQGMADIPAEAEQVNMNLVAECLLAQDAKLEFDQLQRGGSSYSYVGQIEALVAQGAEFKSHTASLDASLIRNNLHVRFDGEHAEAHVNGVYLSADDSCIDNHLLLDHAVPKCLSNQLYKGIASDSGRGVFNGKVFVRKDAQQTNAYQTNKNLVLSPKAIIDTKPQLEIFADDVKCSHGATSGNLDQEAMFYLQARGLSESKARALLLEAFAMDAMSTLPEDAYQEFSNQQIQDYLTKL